MEKLNLPQYTFQTRLFGGMPQILDSVRRRWVRLTPEEWVRQNFVEFMVTECNACRDHIANEMTLPLNNMYKRCDTVLFCKDLTTPFAVVEYKAPTVPITQKVFDQVFSYNRELNVPIIIASNGISHVCLEIEPDKMSYFRLTDLKEKIQKYYR